MIKLISENNKTNLLKRLLAIVFICCSLCLPGHPQTFKQPPVKTEQVFFSSATDLKAAVAYRSLPVKRFKAIIFYKPGNSIALGNKIQVRLNCIAKQFAAFKSPVHFIYAKIIPQNSDEEAASFII